MPNWYSAAMGALFARLRRPARGVSGLSVVRGKNGAKSMLRRAAAPVVEAVESRQMLSVSTDAGGWTVITPPSDARVIYVSSSAGNDASNGLSSSTPVRTLAKASSLVRNGSGDEMLLKRGDTWHESLGTWTKSGRSASEPIVIGAYGTGARPTVASGSGRALVTGTNTYRTVNHLAIMGIHFYADARDPDSATYKTTSGDEGIRITSTTDDLLIEDCCVEGYTTDVNLYEYYGPITNVRIRRSQIVDSYSKASNSEGLFAYGVNGLTLDGNVFDHNGWNPAAGAAQTMYNHDAYIKENVTGLVARGNLFSNASSHGLQARSGGTVENNVFLNDPIGMTFGLVNGSPVTPGGVSGSVRNNVFLGGPSIAGSPRGWGIEVGNTARGGGTPISGNVFANSPTGAGFAINLEYGSGVTNPADAVGINDLTIDGNVVYNWTRALNLVSGLVPGGTGAQSVNGLTVTNNLFQRTQNTKLLSAGPSFMPSTEVFTGNCYDSSAGAPYVNSGGIVKPWTTWCVGRETGSSVTRVTFPDPTRSAAKYAGVTGVGSTDSAFVAAARKQSRANWRTDLTASSLSDYVRAGFNG
jgi:hypothetical protein